MSNHWGKYRQMKVTQTKDTERNTDKCLQNFLISEQTLIYSKLLKMSKHFKFLLGKGLPSLTLKTFMKTDLSVIDQTVHKRKN